MQETRWPSRADHRLRLGKHALGSLGSGPEAEAPVVLALTPISGDEMATEVKRWSTELVTISQLSGVTPTASSLALLANVLARCARQLPLATVSSLIGMVLDERHRHLVDLSQDLVRIAAAHPKMLGLYPTCRGAIANRLRSILILFGASLLAPDAALLEGGTGPAGAEPNWARSDRSDRLV